MATHSIIFVWEIPWMEEPGQGLLLAQTPVLTLSAKPLSRDDKKLVPRKNLKALF